MTEWVWVFLVIWLFVIAFSYISKDFTVQAIGGIMGIVFGIIYLATTFLTGLAMILLNFYFVYQAVIE